MTDKAAEGRIAQMNRLWRLYQQDPDPDTMNEFTDCQRWLSERGKDYYQDPDTKEWKLGISSK